MKHPLLVLCLLAIGNTTQAQHRIPKAVSMAFTKANPTATAVKYSKEKNGNYEANCTTNGIPMSYVYTPKGVLLETEIPISDFPTKVTQAIHKQYPTAIITGGDRIVSTNGTTKYEADLTIGKTKTEKQFDAEGKSIKMK